MIGEMVTKSEGVVVELPGHFEQAPQPALRFITVCQPR